MKQMYSIALPIAPVSEQQIETYSNVEANTYDFDSTTHLEQQVVHASLHTSAHGKSVLHYNPY